ncbi:hypothetical protein HNY73_016075 [Argiope bruennichi]|uniref:Uncharacterized protein n=1 Tax=Argiope bruennichi TaxID=94029 RepID=A0A8T0EHW1_ARGBR|nr:hypothetical protein HNY73_016075 [Argiope bruennichi]
MECPCPRGPELPLTAEFEELSGDSFVAIGTSTTIPDSVARTPLPDVTIYKAEIMPKLGFTSQLACIRFSIHLKESFKFKHP